MVNLVRRTPLNLDGNYEAFPFQLEAFNEIKDLEYSAIFHEQGLGKTKIAIDLALYWLATDTVDSVIFITKKSLVENWIDEITTHANLKVRKISNDRARSHAALHRSSVLFVAHYEAIRTNEKLIRSFASLMRIGVVLDESHKIKNPDSEISKVFHRLNGEFIRRVIMTGSPIANRPYDVWSQIWFLDRGESLGADFKEFKRSLDIPRGGNAAMNSDTDGVQGLVPDEVTGFENSLGQLFPNISAFSVRETKNGAGIDLPRKHYQNIYSSWEQNQEELYQTIRDEMSVDILRDGRVTTDISEELLKRLIRLVQVASNPRLVDEGYSWEPGKIGVLRELLDDIGRCQEKVIIWTMFVDNVTWLASLFSNFCPTVLYGGMSIADRTTSVKRFRNDEDTRILIATPQSSKEGLTLTVANHVIFYDRSFSLDDYIQAQDRIHRISQDKDCHVYNILMNASIDDWVDSLINAKQVAAHFGQGDIDKEEYQLRMIYDLKSQLERVLDSGTRD